MKHKDDLQRETDSKKMKLSPAKHALLEKLLRGQAEDGVATISRLPPDRPAPLSFPQQRQLFLELLERGSAINNLSVLLEIKGILDFAALEHSANQIIARHQILRTSFSFGTGLPACNILSDLRIHVPIVDLQHDEVRQQRVKARQLAEKEVLQPFDLTKAPLIRLKLFVLSDGKYLLIVVVHHTIADGWSLGVFLKELIGFYQKNTTVNTPQSPELPIQYADYAHWQTQDRLKEVLKSSMPYWKNQLEGELPVLELPADRPRGAKQTFSGGTYRFELSGELTNALEKLSREEDVTMFMTLLSAFYVLLHRYSGQDEILVGTPIANRNLPELEPLIGIFINTLVLRVRLSGDLGFRELLKQVRDVCFGAYAHQDLPFEKLVETIKPKRDLSRSPLFQAVFNLQNSPLPTLAIPGLEIRPMEIDRGVSQFDMTLMMTKLEGRYLGTVEYNDDLFQPATVERMFKSFCMILDNVVAKRNCPISELQIIAKEELHLLVHGLNQSKLDFPREKSMHQLFEAQVKQRPDAIAVIYDHRAATYLELNKHANALARHLMALGVGPGICVGILMEKNIEIVEALLGVLKTGGAYVPIHTSFPAERIQMILGEANVKILLTNLDLESLDELNTKVVRVNNDILSIEDNTSNPGLHIDPDSLAYVIFTSGSTGRPKGVMVQHSALMNFLWSMRTLPGIKEDDVLLSVTPISFDIAALELFLPLITGSTLVIADKKMINNPILIGQAIHHYRVNIMQATPATWQLLLEAGWAGEPELKALCGGDVLTHSLADRLLERSGGLWNMYGPTETTIWSSINQIQKGNTPITIGKPIGNTQLYILDEYLQPVPIGVIGGLYIGGEGVARGYLNDASLTDERFIPDFFSSKTGARLYKTGDRARYLADYSIEVLGRNDDQVKVNGHRIELGEIATVLMQHPHVQEALAIMRTEASGSKRITAYFIPKLDKNPKVDELWDFARKMLPNYMIPADLIRLNGLPLSPNGKIDRKSLPLPEETRQLPGYVAPRNEDEEILALIWQDVLDIEQVGIHDNFFELGGASMQSIQIVAKTNMYGFPISVENIFEYQTIAELATRIKNTTND